MAEEAQDSAAPDQVVLLARNMRKGIDAMAEELLAFKSMIGNNQFDTREGENKGEEAANAMLAYRHLEDARMRLGKVIQARCGGVSIYDK